MMGDTHSAVSTQVLTNPELLYDIFAFIPQESLPFELLDRDCHLARCATVCRTFHEPAVRILWRDLDSLLPLWHLLAPPDAPFPFRYFYSRGLEDRAAAYAHVQRVRWAQLHLDPIRWERFLRHARQVRRIAHISDGWRGMDDTARLLVHAVSMQNGGLSVLPLLRSIHWQVVNPDFGDGTLTSVFAPTLRHATFDFAGLEEATIVLILRRLRESSPFLAQITITTGPRLDAGPSVIREMLNFPGLYQVHVSRTGLEGFRALTTKPNITSLGVGKVTGPQVGLDRAISVRDLRELSVKGDLSVLSSLFNLVRFQALKSASIGLDCTAETQLAPADVAQFLARFYNAVSTSGLQTIHLTFHPQTLRKSRGEEPTLRDVLAPLLPIHELRFFRMLATDQLATVDDADIEALANAWPKIEHLSIDEGSTPESSVSIGAIHHLHAHCTDLKLLSIPLLRFPAIGVHEIPPPLDRPVSHPLRHLAVRGNYVLKTSLPSLGPDLSEAGSEAMAQHLLELFPSLDAQRYKREWDLSSEERRGLLPEGLHFDDRWRNVIGHIYAICSAREGF